jgi:nucleotide-binding universal stress UspA family protein
MARILLPVDGSKHCLRTTAKMIEIVKEWRVKPEVLPLYVHLPVPRVGRLGSVIGKATLQRYYEEEGNKALAPAVNLLGKAGFSTKPLILVGAVPETIAVHAKKTKCDFIFMGTRGMTAAANLLMGSMTTKLLHIAEVPVIVVR